MKNSFKFIRDEELRVQAVRDWWGGALWWDEEELERHTPLAVVRASNIEELSKVLSWAGSRGIAVVPRGGGSGVCGSVIPENPETIVLETTRLNKILSIENSSQPTVRVETGILGSALEKELNNKNLSLRHFPGSLEISTLGGWIATGSFGQLSGLYGGIADQLISSKMIVPDGSLIDVVPQDICQSEGTLGIITEATLKVRKKPTQTFALSCEFSDLNTALGFLRELVKNKIQPALCRLYDPLEAQSAGLAYSEDPWLSQETRFKLRFFLLRHLGLVRFLKKLPLLLKRWLLIMVFDEIQEEEFQKAQILVKKERISQKEKPGHIWLSQETQWSQSKLVALFKRNCFVETLDTWASWDKLPGLYSSVMNHVPRLALAMAHASHFDEKGACLFFIFAGRVQLRQEAVDLYHATWTSAMKGVIKAQALVNHHHGVGFAKALWLQHSFEEDFLKRFSSNKKLYDPKGLMNPGKLRTASWAAE